MAQLKNGRFVVKSPTKKKVRKLTIVFTPDVSKAVVITGNEDFSLFENYTLAYNLERALFSRLVEKYEKETGDTSGDEKKIDKWLSKQK